MFFQAEDGIRVIGVTGVQTCALPILAVDLGRLHAKSPQLDRVRVRVPLHAIPLEILDEIDLAGIGVAFLEGAGERERSEERRVEKERKSDSKMHNNKLIT